MGVNRKLTRVIFVVYALSADCVRRCAAMWWRHTHAQTTGYSCFHCCHVTRFVVTDEEVLSRKSVKDVHCRCGVTSFLGLASLCQSFVKDVCVSVLSDDKSLTNIFLLSTSTQEKCD